MKLSDVLLFKVNGTTKIDSKSNNKQNETNQNKSKYYGETIIIGIV